MYPRLKDTCNGWLAVCRYSVLAIDLYMQSNVNTLMMLFTFASVHHLISFEFSKIRVSNEPGVCAQVLEPQNVDPSMVQMTFLDDVVHSLLKGENIGITSRRRSRSSQNNNAAHVSTDTEANMTYSDKLSVTCAVGTQRKIRNEE